MIHCDTLVIGAGASGLYFSHLQKKSSEKIIILEKSRGVGGRFATRRIDNRPIDHGIQWLHSKPPVFGEKTVRQAQGYYFPDGMTAFAKLMAKDLEIHFSQRAKNLSYKNSHWITETLEGETYQSTRVIITSPLPQTMDLLGREHCGQLPHYSKALEGIFILDEIPTTMISFEKNDHIFTFMKDKNLHPKALVVALSAEVSEENFERPDGECLEMVLDVFKEYLPKLKFSHVELKRWRYARPLHVLPEPFLELEKDLFLIGDSFCDGETTGAFASAEALSKKLSSI